MTITKEAIELLAKSEAIRAASARLPEHQAALPADFKIHDFESAMQLRARPRGTMTTVSLSDFVGYAELHCNRGGSAAFIDAEKMQAVAVLNMGTVAAPGHCDYRAVFAPPKTAAFKALLSITGRDRLEQRVIAEFMEDWIDCIKCFDDVGELAEKHAIAAVRSITIESARSVESQVGNLSAEQGTLERVAASSKKAALPTFIHFKCQPNSAIDDRIFILRLGVYTGDKAPTLTLRVVKAEEHQEQMAAELAARVRAAMTAMPVIVGTLQA